MTLEHTRLTTAGIKIEAVFDKVVNQHNTFGTIASAASEYDWHSVLPEEPFPGEFLYNVHQEIYQIFYPLQEE